MLEIDINNPYILQAIYEIPDQEIDDIRNQEIQQKFTKILIDAKNLTDDQLTLKTENMEKEYEPNKIKPQANQMLDNEVNPVLDNQMLEQQDERQVIGLQAESHE